MTRKTHAAGCISRSLQTASFQPVWITDNLLADAFHRFSCPHRRHGSNVPGPLEARRRAAKRKNTNWAHVQNSAPSIEPAVLFGKLPPGGWWQKEQIAEQPATPSILPPWLFKPPDPPHPPVASAAYDERADARDSTTPSLTSRLEGCKNIKELHDLVHEHGIDLQQRAQSAKTIFYHITSSLWPSKEICSFLTDPAFNPPSSQSSHHADLLRLLQRVASGRIYTERSKFRYNAHLYSQFMQPQAWAKLVEALCRAAQLGLIPPRAMQPMLNDLYALEGERMQDEESFRATYDLLVSFEESKVFSIKDLDPIWIREMSAKLNAGALNSWTLQILSRLQTESEMIHTLNKAYLQATERHNIESGLADLIETLIKPALRPPAIPLLSRYRTKNEIIEVVCATIIKHLRTHQLKSVEALLTCLPTPMMLRVLAAVTSRCVVSIRAGQLAPQMMSTWGAFIARQRIPTLRSWLLDGPNFMILRAWLSDQLTPQEQTFASLWLVLQVSCPGKSPSKITYEDIARRLCLRDEKDVLIDIESASLVRDHMSQIAFAIRELPFDEEFVGQVIRLTKCTWASRVPVVPSKSISLVSESVRFTMLAHDQAYHRVRLQRSAELITFSESINVDLNDFVRLAKKVIWGDKKAFRVVKRVLQHNIAFKFSLSQSWPQRLRYQRHLDGSSQTNSHRLAHNVFIYPPAPLKLDKDESASDDPAYEGHTNQVISPPRPADALETIGRLATSFALSQAVEPRSALLQVYWCYIFLHRCGAPITPAISRALWHAGVVRYRGSGPSTTQLKWILQVVEQVEGKGVASMLLWNSSFRKQREELLESLNKDGVAREGGAQV